MGESVTATVLIVDDEEANIELLSRTLRQDARLLVARSAEDARNILSSQRVDVVVTDHRLPAETGAALLRWVATEHPQVARVLVTAYGDSSEVMQAVQQGVIERFFLKPYPPARLKVGVLELLWRRKLAKPPTVLVADDIDEIRQMVCDFLASAAIETETARDGEEAIEMLGKKRYDAAILDLSMPKLDGVGVFEYVRQRDPDLPVLIITASGFMIGLDLLEAGVFDFLSKPLRREELLMRVKRAILARHQSEEHKRLLKEIEAVRHKRRVVAASPLMLAVMDKAKNVAGFDVNVLITGETGTGKEVLARYIHESSRRREAAFVALNCGALPENLVEAELFGHERGAFTDAKAARRGIFEAADGGSVFLDEIGELSPQAQTRLLRVLEAKEITRIGSTKPLHVDVRVITATHRDLEQMIAAGTFRQDLFYRLNVVRLDIPPLRERPEDILPLIEMAMSDFCARNHLPAPHLTPEVLAQAHAYAWPGNVRELLHVVERTLITNRAERLERLDLGPASAPVIMPAAAGAGAGGGGAAAIKANIDLPLREALEPVYENLEKDYLLRLLARCDGHLGETAKKAGIHRKSLYNKIKRYDVSVEEALAGEEAD